MVMVIVETILPYKAIVPYKEGDPFEQLPAGEDD